MSDEALIQLAIKLSLEVRLAMKNPGLVNSRGPFPVSDTPAELISEIRFQLAMKNPGLINEVCFQLMTKNPGLLNQVRFLSAIEISGLGNEVRFEFATKKPRFH